MAANASKKAFLGIYEPNNHGACSLIWSNIFTLSGRWRRWSPKCLHMLHLVVLLTQF